MKSINILSLLLLVSTLGYNQIAYEVVTDHPEFSDISIKPALGVEVGAGWGASYELSVEYRKTNIPVQISAYYRNNFVGSQNVDSDRHEGLQSMEIGVGYALSRKKTYKSIPVILKSTLSAYTVYYETYNIKYINAKGNGEKQFIARLGYFNYRGAWTANESGGDIVAAINGQTAYMKGVLNTNGIYTGISLLSRKNLQISTQDFGKVRKTAHTEIYLDLLFASNVSAGDYEDTEGLLGSAGVTYDVDEQSDIDKSNFGLRIGWIYNITNFEARKSNGLFFKFETGTRPGIVKNQLFFVGTFGIAINKG